jgi:ring-1,2-phenylacetyl-CoA epoxidase subunit PaaC
MNPELEEALGHRLLALADDELILAHRNSEWCGHAPILEEDIAFANIAQDEMGHARLWYELYCEGREADPDQLVFFREVAGWRNARLLELPRGDWAFSMVRQYLFDLLEMVRLDGLAQSSNAALAAVAEKVRREEVYHLRHTEAWMRRLGLGTAESNRRTQQALDALWTHVPQLFLPLGGEVALVTAAVVPDAGAVQAQWLAVAIPFLEEVGLTMPDWPEGAVEDRTVHTPHLNELLATLQEVARQDRGAIW